MILLARLGVAIALAAVGKGEKCAGDDECRQQRPHLICVEVTKTCEIGCRTNDDCAPGSFCVPLPFPYHKQCARTDPRSDGIQ